MGIKKIIKSSLILFLILTLILFCIFDFSGMNMNEKLKVGMMLVFISALCTILISFLILCIIRFSKADKLLKKEIIIKFFKYFLCFIVIGIAFNYITRGNMDIIRIIVLSIGFSLVSIYINLKN
jgi:hypothetical protein